jgi:hypothetical protein
MPADPRDDFRAFDGVEQMFYDLPDPYAQIRVEVLRALRRQVPDTELDAIRTFDKPKFLTIGRQVNEGRNVVVTHFAFCVRAYLAVRNARGAHELTTALTLMYGRVDEPNNQTFRIFVDVGADSLRAHDDDELKQRFVAFHQNP